MSTVIPEDREGREMAMIGLLVLQKLDPLFREAVPQVKAKFAEGSPEEAAFINGAIYGVVTYYMREHSQVATTEAIQAMYSVVTQVLNNAVDHFDMDLDRYGRALLGEV